MELRNRVKEMRARFNLSQSELGKLVDVSRQTIGLIEKGDYSPSVFLALKIAKVFESSVEEIFRLEEDEDDEDQ
ncbi:putative transcriptional regulator [Gottschalkia purinilytica]|uniref:Putative transcriptional regulator n=1 Tax=Gottschalkia purinilytica TaxID=1503 RepID=A0A0L0W9S8_GOTPU|nr:helix-turn-helix transcriptional regulator [Gottschalkia purinilytica]KNF08289.1 putative transcriptional regulator [Gottschalkia purinilytica]